MKKIAIALTKGGVGKTTTAVNLAAGLASFQRSVLLIDVDTQGQVAKMLNCQPRAGLAEVMHGEASIADALFPARQGVWLLAGGRGMAGVKRTITRREFNAENTLSETLQDLDGNFDYILIDTAPGWDTLNINVFFYAETILSPVSLEILTLQGLLDFKQNLETIKKYRPELKLEYILPTFFDRRVRKSSEIIVQLRHHFGAQICEPIRYNVRLSEAPGYGQTIFEYAPGSNGAEDYRKLTERILADE